MNQPKKSLSLEKVPVWAWFLVGIGLAIAFIVIGSVFFGLKPGPSNTSETDTEQIDPSLYAPSGY